jgi:hypothetical protein
MTRDLTTPPLAEKTDTLSRAKGVQDQEAGLRTRLQFRRARRRYGHVPLPTRILAHQPKLLALFQQMNKYTITPAAVSPKFKELVQLKVAAMVGCPF